MNRHTNPADGCRSCTTRRAVLVAAAAGAGVALSGCAVYGRNDAPPEPPGTAGAGGRTGAATDGAGVSGGTGDPGAATGSAGAGGGAIARLGDVPVGGGMVLADRRVVLTRPTADTVRAFSAVCTHAGCTVAGVSGGTINCPCHGSAFRIADGSVAKGPAPQPLPTVGVVVDGDAIRLG